MVFDFKNEPGFRPAEIKTYHQDTYDRISPTKTKFEGKGKTLFITAGATGIGYSICESFAKAGISRIIIVQRRQEVLDAAKKSLEAAYPHTKVEVYVGSQSDFPRMTEIIKAAGEIDVLVPCATAFVPMLPAKDMKTEDLVESHSVNVIGLFHMVREFMALPSTASGGPKSVIHITSSASQMYMLGASWYCSSKAAGNHLITHFGYDAPEGNVKFFSLHPGAIRTPLASANIPEDLCVWEDVKMPGDFSVWLASPEATFLNGRYLWAAWDVDDLIALKDKLAGDPTFLTTGLSK